MFYSIFVFALGVFVGQEYPTVPSVKNCFNTAVSYIQTYQTSPSEIQQPFTNLEYIKQFFKKNE